VTTNAIAGEGGDDISQSASASGNQFLPAWFQPFFYGIVGN
jgi:hypothetical protein